MAMEGLYDKTLNRRENPAGSTRCFRCTGLMVAEESFDSMVGHSRADFLVRRCVQCGEVIDPVILQRLFGPDKIDVRAFAVLYRLIADGEKGPHTGKYALFSHLRLLKNNT